MRVIVTYIVFFFFCISGASGQSVERKTFYDQEKTVLKESFFVYDTVRNHLDGPFTSYYLSGKVKSKGNYGFNTPTGVWEYFYENGNLKSTGSFMTGKTLDIWTYFYENGNKRSEGILNDNVKAGHWTYYFENGGVKNEGQYIEGIREGTWYYYYEAGALKAKAEFNNGSGIYKEYYTSGTLKMSGLNHEGKSDSLWVYYYQSGRKMAEGYYDDGVKMGTWKYYYENGTLSAEGGFEKGQTIGNWIYYYETGAKSSEGLKKNGMKDGYWKMFYETGETKGIGELDEGTGEYKEYYISGKLKVTGYLKEGVNDGHWTYYDEEGHVEGIADFSQGMGNYEGYYLDGSIKMKGKISNGKRVDEWTLYDTEGEIAGKYHPVYHKENNILEQEDSYTPDRPLGYDKPAYRYKNRQSRFFKPVVNEYRGVILESNPILSLVGLFPFSVEYYMQERLGYGLEYIHHRQPFYQSHNGIEPGDVYRNGFQIQFKQKFYFPDQSYGMFYMGHLVGFKYLEHTALPEPENGLNTVRADERNYFYGIIIGDQWTQDPGNAGLTFDVYFGFGLGIKDFQKGYSDPVFDSYFNDIHQGNVYVPVFFGINIGYLGFKKKPKSSLPPRK